MADDVQVQFGASVAGALAGIGQVRNGIEGLTAPITALSNALSAIGEVLIVAFAVDKIEEFINKFTELGAQSEHLSQQLGISAEAVGEFGFAAGAVGVSLDGAARMMERLERNMSQAAGSATGPAARAFQALGITVTDAEGHLRSLDSMLPEIAAKFAETRDGPEKTAIAMALMGRAGADMIPVLDLGAKGLADFAEAAQRAGSVPTDAMAKGMEQTSIATHELGQSLVGIGITIYEGFKPAIDAVITGLTAFFEECNQAMKGTGPLNEALALLVDTVDVFINAIMMAIAGLKTLWSIAITTIQDIVTAWNTLGTVMYDVVTGNWSKLTADYQAGMDKLKQDTIAGTKDILDAWKSYYDQEQALMRNSSGLNVDTSGGSLVKPGGGRFDTKPTLPEIKPPSTGGGESQVTAWTADLNKMIEVQVGFFKDSTDLEIKFWSDKLAAAKDGTKLYDEIYAKLFEAQKKGAQQQLQDELADIKNKEAIHKNDYDTVIALENQKLAILAQKYGEDSRQYKAAEDQKLAIVRQHEDQVRAIRLATGQTQLQIDQMELADQRTTLNQEYQNHQITLDQKYEGLRTLIQKEYQAELDQVNQELLIGNLSLAQEAALNQKKLLLRQQLISAENNLDNQRQAEENQIQQQIAGKLAGSFNTMLNGILQGTQTTTQLIGNMFGNMIIAMIEQIDELIAEWLVFEALGIGSNPFAGSSGGILGKLLGFDVGTERVPQDMIAKIHKDEMIIPAAQANQIRSAEQASRIGQSNEAGGSGGGGFIYSPTIHIQAMDAAGVDRVLEEHGKRFAQNTAHHFTYDSRIRPRF